MSESHPIFVTTVKEFSVSELSLKIKQCVENNIGYVRVKGEISGLKVASSGHGYFNLKDNDAIIATTCWRPVMARLKFKPMEGMEVVVSGRVTTYAGQSRYQLSAETIEPGGLGAMMQILQERRERLEREGLFDVSKKKPLPFMPRTIGVVTSITGAVIRDIVHRISDRCPARVIIWPVTVQGEAAASEITAAIEGFGRLAEPDRPELLIVARGGGSIEDLWCFNEENVVRAVAASRVPVISAVGHETDYTLIDMVADRRAPTPTAAAEFAVPVLEDLRNTLLSSYSRMSGRTKQMLHYGEQRLDDSTLRLTESLPKWLRVKTNYLEPFTGRRFNPRKLLEYKALQLKHQGDNLISSFARGLKNLEATLALQASLLASMDYNNVLKRGFALVATKENKVIPSKQLAENEQRLCIRFFDGEIEVGICHSRESGNL